MHKSMRTHEQIWVPDLIRPNFDQFPTISVALIFAMEQCICKTLDLEKFHTLQKKKSVE